jgi:hypothetical protein
MPDLNANIAVIDGPTPRGWPLFNRRFGEFVADLGDIHIRNDNPVNPRRFRVKILMDDVANWNVADSRAVVGFIIDGELLLQHALDDQNPVLARLQHVLRLLKADAGAYYQYFGLRFWIMRPDRAEYKGKNSAVVSAVLATLQVTPDRITIQGISSLAVAAAELLGVPEELMSKERFLVLEVK